MMTPPITQDFSTGTLGEKKANVKEFFFSQRLAFTPLAVHMKSEIQTNMDTRPVPPASITIASILGILASGGVLIISLLLGLGARGAPPKSGAQITAHSRMILQAVSYVLLAAGVLGVVNGISLLALQSWARRMTVIASGLTVILSTYCLYMSLALLGVPPTTSMTSRASHVLWGSFFGVSLLVFGLGLWFTSRAKFLKAASIPEALPQVHFPKRLVPFLQRKAQEKSGRETTPGTFHASLCAPMRRSEVLM